MITTSTTLDREQLIAERRRLKRGAWKDFVPPDGRCPRCRADIVAHYATRFPTADITGCPKCSRSLL